MLRTCLYYYYCYGFCSGGGGAYPTRRVLKAPMCRHSVVSHALSWTLSVFALTEVACTSNQEMGMAAQKKPLQLITRENYIFE